MDEEQGADVLRTALRDAESESWSCRAAAGRQLAAIADQAEAAPVLERLLLDPHDTGVTQDTAEALLQRGDLVGLRTVLRALSRAREACAADQLDGEVFSRHNWMVADGRGDQFVRQLASLAADEDVGVREEARQFLGERAENAAPSAVRLQEGGPTDTSG
ncbi:hypothetical protein [Streptomyces sp. NPDC086010]|uniref:hypothetical protein n=1 Tax=Streptomyces sp. NPDC086010 TaxID=3365745 RepID=UPI0037D15235